MGKLKNPDGVGQVGNPTCGDLMTVYIKVKDNRIKDISFETLGCVAAVATSSMVTELAKGKTLAQAKKISYNDLINALGKLPPIKIHCSNLAVEALQAAIKDYENRKQK